MSNKAASTFWSEEDSRNFAEFIRAMNGKVTQTMYTGNRYDFFIQPPPGAQAGWGIEMLEQFDTSYRLEWRCKEPA